MALAICYATLCCHTCEFQNALQVTAIFLLHFRPPRQGRAGQGRRAGKQGWPAVVMATAPAAAQAAAPAALAAAGAAF